MSGWSGEVVETRSTEVVAQSYTAGEAPPFGSLVSCQLGPTELVYAVVYDVRTTGIDPGARPVVRGRDGVRNQAIYDENPDLTEVLRTDTSALFVGYRTGGAIRYGLPPTPPPLHWTVSECDGATSRLFCEQTGYLRTLLDAPQAAADELVGAHIRCMDGYAEPGDDYLMRAGRALAELLRLDYPRLRAIVERIRGA